MFHFHFKTTITSLIVFFCLNPTFEVFGKAGEFGQQKA